MTEIQLSAEGLTVDYGELRALSSITLSAGIGATALLGPNGAGKSTLIRCLATVQEPDRGSISFSGVGLTNRHDRRSYRRRLGYMPQEAGAYSGWRVITFLSYIAALKEVPSSEIMSECLRVLDAVDLTEKRNQRIRSLSGGMRQRLGLACALLRSPQLLILDEPTAGLDPEQRMQFRRIITAEANRACVLISTHLTEEVTAFCTRVLVLDHGHLLFDGTPSELAARAAGYTWLAPAPHPSAWASWDVPEGIRQVCPTRPRDGVATAPTIDDGYLIVLHGPNTHDQDNHAF